MRSERRVPVHSVQKRENSGSHPKLLQFGPDSTSLGSYFEHLVPACDTFWAAVETFGGQLTGTRDQPLKPLFSHALSLVAGPLQCKQPSPVLPTLPLMGCSAMLPQYGRLNPLKL